MSALVSYAGLVVPFHAYPQQYAMRVDGDCCAPDIPDGSSTVMDQKAEVQAGDFVCIWATRTRNGLTAVEPMIKRLVWNMAPWALGRLPYVLGPNEIVLPVILFETLNPPRQYQADARGVFGIHKVVGVTQTDRLTTIDGEELRLTLDPSLPPRPSASSKPKRRARVAKGGAA